MSNGTIHLQYVNAVRLACRYKHEAEILYKQIETAAFEEAEFAVTHSSLLSEPSQRAHSIGRFDSLPPETLAEFRRGGKYFGLYAETARRRAVQPNYVISVAHGRQLSSPTLAALRVCIREVDAQIPKSTAAGVEPFSPQLLLEMGHGGRYYGIYARVARSLGLQRSNVAHVARGEATSRRVLLALRAEMARVDAEIAAKNGDAQ